MGPGEECDDGNQDNADECVITGTDRTQCKKHRCGDLFVFKARAGSPEKSEDCDEGVDSATGITKDSATCNKDCTTAVCGDGYVNKVLGEQCEEGRLGTLACTGNTGDPQTSCKLSQCGDGIVNRAIDPKTNYPIEQCEPGLDGPGACDSDCTLRHCGDGDINPLPLTNAQGELIKEAEQCDDGGETKYCTATCKYSSCGDGYFNKTGEECDSSASDSPVQCLSNCTMSVCGDGRVDTRYGEECDPGLETSTCTRYCNMSRCGDSYVNVANEVCDDGNAMSGDGCSSSCRSIEAGWTCPNGAGLPCRRI